MALFDIKGCVVQLGETKSIGSNGFLKREIVIDIKEESSHYPNPVKFVAVKDTCSQLDGLRPGDKVSFKFFLDGHPWDGNKGRVYFTDLRIYKILSSSQNQSSAVPKLIEEPDAEDMPF